MQITRPFPPVESTSLPPGVVLQARKPTDANFDEVPRNWFAHCPRLSRGSDLFSFIIPEHERFFIHTVRSYLKHVEDPHERTLLKAFMKQEAIHYMVHDAYNASRRPFVDVDRDLATIKRTFDWVKRRIPLKWRLGMTAFMEHCTAASAHVALGRYGDLQYQHPTMREMWRWHAVEEIEHKAVAFDLFQRAGGGYLLRVFTALLTVAIDAALFRRLIRNARRDLRALKAAGHREPELTPEQLETRREARQNMRRNSLRLLRFGLQYFAPGFHPWQIDDSRYLKAPYEDYGNLPRLPASAE